MKTYEKLVATRAAHGLTQKDICEIYDLSPRTITNWESGAQVNRAFVELIIRDIPAAAGRFCCIGASGSLDGQVEIMVEAGTKKECQIFADAYNAECRKRGGDATGAYVVHQYAHDRNIACSAAREAYMSGMKERQGIHEVDGKMIDFDQREFAALWKAGKL